MTTPATPARLYLDSSALVARYYREPHTLTALPAVAAAGSLASNYAAYPETRSALARLRREKRLTGLAHSGAVAQLAADWPALERLEVGDVIALAAGVLTERNSLKGYDAVHLASALVFSRMPGGVVFLSYDARLNRAAQFEGLAVWTP